eukprot:s93_g13.t1
MLDQRVRIRISYAKGSIAELRLRAPQVVELPDCVPILPRSQADEKWPLVTKVEVLKKWKAGSAVGVEISSIFSGGVLIVLFNCPPEPMPKIVTGRRQDRRFYGKALKHVPRWDPSPADYAFVGEGMLLVFSPDGRRAVRDRDSPIDVDQDLGTTLGFSIGCQVTEQHQCIIVKVPVFGARSEDPSECYRRAVFLAMDFFSCFQWIVGGWSQQLTAGLVGDQKHAAEASWLCDCGWESELPLASGGCNPSQSRKPVVRCAYAHTGNGHKFVIEM